MTISKNFECFGSIFIPIKPIIKQTYLLQTKISPVSLVFQIINSGLFGFQSVPDLGITVKTDKPAESRIIWLD